ncbi:hypothetical protein CCACVL1_15601 [Corchorus capsularis]|uniref:Uncharacterized protein n=1 Tax=Corchorus capsularis TaxID=210143 RepID=A0A1R3I1W4_COCAP|nr:hypothetical protein CCACVL1_15601 [Corchorus capsularis]
MPKSHTGAVGTRWAVGCVLQLLALLSAFQNGVSAATYMILKIIQWI